jgi:hypothetical protein
MPKTQSARRSTTTKARQHDPAPTPPYRDPEELLPIPKARQELGLPPKSSWLYDQSRLGAESAIRFVKIGRHLRVRRSDIQAYVASRAYGGPKVS